MATTSPHQSAKATPEAATDSVCHVAEAIGIGIAIMQTVLTAMPNPSNWWEQSNSQPLPDN